MIKKIIQAIRNNIRKIGFDIVRYPLREIHLSPIDYDYRQQLLRMDIDLILDIGANKGQYGLWLIKNLDWKGAVLSFEPIGAMHKLLSEQATKYPHWQIFRKCAIGDENKTVEINVAAAPASSSILKMTPDFLSHLNIPISSIEQVEQIRLDTIEDERIDKAKNLFVKIDVQGYEYKVLSGIGSLYDKIKGFHLEASLSFEHYEGEKLFFEIDQFMREKGYFISYIFPESVSAKGDMRQINVLYRKKE